MWTEPASPASGRSRLGFSALALAVACTFAAPACNNNPCPPPAKALPPEASVAALNIPGSGAKTLILYDTSGPWGVLGELYATQVANLSGRFGTFIAKPVQEYAAGDLERHDALVYVGSSYDEPLGDTFLREVLASTKPILWLYQNVWKLQEKRPTFADERGWRWVRFDEAAAAKEVRYKGRVLSRDPNPDNGPLSLVEITRPELAHVVADAAREDGTTLPWAVRSGSFTYVAELPLRYVRQSDRYLAV